MSKPFFTPEQAIDAIIDRYKDDDGRQSNRWGARNPDRDDVTVVNYSYPGVGDVYGDGTKPLAPDQIDDFERYILLIEDVANIDLVRVEPQRLHSDDGDLRIQRWDEGGGQAYGNRVWTPHGYAITDALVTVNDIVTQRLSLHEMGHALGLYHPGNYNGPGHTYADDATHFQDSTQYTIMSYFGGNETGASYGRPESATFMVHDVMALQYLYGANDIAFAGDTIYGFNSNTDRDAWTATLSFENIYGAIWDAGGIDTIDASEYLRSSTINLGEYEFSSLNGQTYNLAIVPGAVIENAIGGLADDRLHGNSSNNVLTGGAGYDWMYGYAGDDTLFGGTWGDYSGISDGRDGNYLAGGSGDDTLYGTDGYDSIYGGDDDDYLRGNGDVDFLDGGGGQDAASYVHAPSRVVVDLVAGTASGGDGADWLRAIEDVHGSAYDDRLIGNGGGNALYGRRGDDYLLGNAGDDHLDGGEDSDVVSYANATSGMIVDLLAGTAVGGDGQDTLVSIEHVFGSDHRDIIGGTTGSNTILGYDGGDILFAGTYRDDDGNTDWFTNVLNGGGGNDVLYGADGNDRLLGGAGGDRLVGNAGSDTLDGGEDVDTVDYTHAEAGVTVDLDAGTASGGDGTDRLVSIERVYGSAFDDRLVGDDGDNLLNGRDGYDTLIGGDGADTLHAGFDTDGSLLVAGDETDYGGDGDVASNRLHGSNGSDYVRGGDGNDIMTGGDASDYLMGNGGNDTIDGGAGIDTIYHDYATAGVRVDLANGTSSGGDGSDTLRNIEWADGSRFDDHLTGSAGANRLRGLDGDDVILGGLGADTISGDGGDDWLFGRSYDRATDVFVFAPGHGADRIRDFENGVDRIRYDQFWSDAPTSFSALTITNDGSNAIVSVTDDSSFGSIELYRMAGDLDASDFLFT
ncbi:MAG: M10 family metallopeptidase C-terminal domain-containing protein [Pseudomonadota bacterium]